MMRRSVSSFSFSNAIQRKAYSGLLSGLNNIDHIKNAQFYASAMDIKSTADFLKQSSYVYQQAEKDFKLSNHSNFESYINFLEGNKRTWMRNNSFFDRELILKSVNSIINNEGQFICLLGGKSTGKTLLWDHLTNAKNNEKHLSVIHLNMRTFGDADILKALLTYLEKTKTERVTQFVLETVSSFFTNTIDSVKNYILQRNDFKTADLLNLLRTHHINDSEVLKELLRRLSLMFGNITVVIDEANLAFTEEVDRDLTRLMKAKRDLEALTSLSKELKQVLHLMIFILSYFYLSYYFYSTD
jgi:Cdc6-like AAA superfamily ATPase